MVDRADRVGHLIAAAVNDRHLAETAVVIAMPGRPSARLVTVQQIAGGDVVSRHSLVVRGSYDDEPDWPDHEAVVDVVGYRDLVLDRHKVRSRNSVIVKFWDQKVDAVVTRGRGVNNKVRKGARG